MQKFNVRPLVLVALVMCGIMIPILSALQPGGVAYMDGPTPTPTQAAHYYIVDYDGFVFLEWNSCSVEMTPEYTGPISHPDTLRGMIFDFLPVGGPAGFKQRSTVNGTSDSIFSNGSSTLAGSSGGRFCYLTYGTSQEPCTTFSAGGPGGVGAAPFLTSTNYNAAYAIDPGESGYMGFILAPNCGANVEALITNIKLIYHGNNEPAGGCTSDFYLGSSSEGTIDSTLSGGVTLSGLATGQWYAIETAGGPWKTQVGNPDRYDVAVSTDNGSTWAPLPIHPDFNTSCVTSPGPNYVRVYFQAQAGKIYKLRVNDTSGNFANNLGSMDYILYSAYPISGDFQSPLCDGNMEQFPVSDCWLPGEGYPPNEDGFGRKFAPDVPAGIDTAACGAGFQAIGALVKPNFPGTADETVPDIFQEFYWEGGTMYFRFSVTGNMSPYQSANDVWYDMYIYGEEAVFPFNPIDGIALTEQQALYDWRVVTGFIPSLPPGNFRIEFQLNTDRSNPLQDTIYIDDVVISNSPPPSACDPQPTPTTTPTPNLTGTPTPNPILDNYIDNCSFEQGNAFWSFTGVSQVIYNAPAEAPDGDNYALVYDEPGQADSITQFFTWPGGNLYSNLWGKGFPNVTLKNFVTGQTWSIVSFQDTLGNWAFYQKLLISIPAGVYQIILSDQSWIGGSRYDAITISDNGFTVCAGGAVFTPTAVSTFTPGPTPSPLPTNAPTSTPTVWPTWTPQPTFTPNPTHTQPATPTQPPTHTPESESTNTPPPSYTPPPTYTPYPTNSPFPVPPPNQQPPSACDAQCIRPWNPADLAGWSEYNRCESQKWISFCDYHSATAVAIPNAFEGSEPFGTFGELEDTASQLEGLINSYDWNTGLSGVDDPPLFNDFSLGDDSPWNSGSIDLFPEGSVTYSNVCEARLTEVVGERLSVSMCFIFNILDELALMPWFQLFVNGSMIGVLVLWLYKKLIDPAFE